MGAYNDDILFVHIPKCAGTSVKHWMKDNLPGTVLPRDPHPDNPEKYAMPFGHIRLADIEAATGRHPSTWKRILAVVRNPYEREVSQALFWANRYLKGDRHEHDLNTWRHVRGPIFEPDIMRAALNGNKFKWGPEHLDFLSWLVDPSTSFHVWYEQHVVDPQPTRKTYEDYGGFYRYWLELDGEIPATLCLLRQETLADDLRAALEIEGELPIKNHVNYHRDVRDYYTPQAVRVVNKRYEWCFGEGWYEQWLV